MLPSYGECGYVRIMEIISELFPDLATELRSGKSSRYLDSVTFMSRILVPETARLLIKGDLNVSDEEAMNILFRSQAFGLALHPELDVEDPCSASDVCTAVFCV